MGLKSPRIPLDTVKATVLGDNLAFEPRDERFDALLTLFNDNRESVYRYVRSAFDSLTPSDYAGPSRKNPSWDVYGVLRPLNDPTCAASDECVLWYIKVGVGGPDPIALRILSFKITRSLWLATGIQLTPSADMDDEIYDLFN